MTWIRTLILIVLFLFGLYSAEFIIKNKIAYDMNKWFKYNIANMSILLLVLYIKGVEKTEITCFIANTLFNLICLI